MTVEIISWSMGPGQDRTHNLWICSQAPYQLHYVAQYTRGPLGAHLNPCQVFTTKHKMYPISRAPKSILGITQIKSLSPIKIYLSAQFQLGLARLIEISVNRSIYKRKTIIDMKIQKSVTFNVCSVYLFN